MVSGSRSSTATVVVVTVEASAPTVDIVSQSSLFTNFNVRNSLKLDATIDLEAPETASWYINDVLIDQTLALTTVSESVVPPLATLNLVLTGDMLPSASTLLFKLKCGVGFSTFTVVTNGPPTSGVFTVDPVNGVEIVSVFTFTASRWVDIDLPLYYDFSMLTATGVTQVVQTRSEKNYAVPPSGLPRGSDVSNYTLGCLLSVYDSLLSSVVTSTTVRVTPSANSVAYSSLTSSLNATSGSTEIDDTASIVATGSTVVNDIICTGAPNCTLIYRSDCGSVSNTCGNCISGYVGTDYANSACVTSTTSESRKLSTACGSDSDCSLWQVCQSSVCSSQTISCTSADQCSGRGTCSYVSKSTYESVSTCSLGDASCQVWCSCDTGYDGYDCSSDSDTFVQKTDMRSELISAFYTQIETQDPTVDAVDSWVSSLTALCQRSDELTTTSIEQISNISMIVVGAAATLGMGEEIPGLLTALDAILNAVAFNNKIATSGSRRKLTSVTESQVDLFSEYAKGVMESMIYGQQATTAVFDQFKMSVSVLSSSNGEVSVSSPLSGQEEAYGVSSVSTVKVVVDSTFDSSVKLTLIELKSVQYSSEITTDPILLVMDDVRSCSSTGSCVLEVGLDVLTPQTYVYDIEVQEYDTNCLENGNIENIYYSCAYGTTGSIFATCYGNTTEHIVSTCDANMYTPICGRFATDGSLVDDSCNIVSTSSSGVSCSCTIPLDSFDTSTTSSSRRRLLTATTGSIEIAGSYICFFY